MGEALINILISVGSGGTTEIVLKLVLLLVLGAAIWKANSYLKEAQANAARQEEADARLKDQVDVARKTREIGSEADKAADEIDKIVGG